MPPPTPNPALGPLQIVGQIGGPTQAIAVSSNYAYVGVGSRLMVVDLSNASSPREIGSSEPFGAPVRNVKLDGNTAFVTAGGAGLYVVDISNPARPTTLGNFKSLGYAEGVSVVGNYAFIADGPDGLRIVNIADRAHPVQVSSAYKLNYAFDVIIDGDYAFIAAAGAGLLIADVSDPTHPKEIDSYGLPGYAYGIAKLGATLYVADGWEGLQVLDVSDPAKPKSIGAYNSPGWAMDVVAKGNLVYLADASGGLRILDVSDKSNITEKGNFSTPDGHAQHLAVDGGTIFLADIRAGVHIVDVSTPSRPRRTGVYSPMGIAQAVTIANGYAYVAAQNYGLRVIDLTDVTHPSQVARVDTELPAVTIASSGHAVYVGTFVGGKSKLAPSLFAVDVSDPFHSKASRPQPLEGHTGITTAQGKPPPSGNIISLVSRYMFTQGTILYNAGEWGLLLVDISDRLAPHELGFIQTTGDPSLPDSAIAVSVAVAGNVAYLAVSGAGLYLIDVSNPKQPALLGVFNEQVPGGKDPKTGKLADVALAPPYAYILYDDMVRVLDISDPKHPKGLGAFPVPLPTFNNGGGVRALAVDGNKLFIADHAAGLIELDVTDPTHLKLVGQLRLPGIASWVIVDRGLVYVADGEGGLFIVQAVQQSSAMNSVPVARHDRRENSLPNIPAVASFSRASASMPAQLTLGMLQRVSFRRPASSGDMLSIPESAAGNVCTVASTADSGPGTLRECLQKVRSGDVIDFAPAVFPPKNPSTIYVLSELGLGGNGGITIDASHAGVILDGSRASKGTWGGLNINSDNNVVKGLQILNFPVNGISLSGAHNTIGGDRTRGEAPIGEGNVIGGSGVFEIETKVAFGNLIKGNYIGLDATGQKRIGKPGYWSIAIWSDSASNRIERNVIAGTIGISDAGSSYNEIIGNHIGTDASGTIPLSDDAEITVWLPFNRIGGTQPGEGNVINGRIRIQGTSDVIVMGNRIGVDATSKQVFPLSARMISLGEGANHNFIGGMTDAERNVVAGGKDSILIQLSSIANYNFIAGNYIGTDASGNPVFPNIAGIFLEMAERNAIQGNLIAGSQTFGISLASLNPNQASADFNWVRANRITKCKVGLGIGNGEGNTMAGNTFVENGVNAQDRGRNNHWDDPSARN
jgi:hypothetical protein